MALIDEVADEVERGGQTDWAPVHTVEDWEDIDSPDDPPSLNDFSDEPSEAYGTPLDREARARVKAALNELQDALDKPPPIGIGHNQPPEEIEPEEIKRLGPAVRHLRAEFDKPNPSIVFIKQWAKPVREALIASAKWAGRKVDKGVDAGTKALGAGLGLWLWTRISPSLHNAFNAIIEWLHIVAKGAS